MNIGPIGRPKVGLTLQPDGAFLELVRPLDVDYYEVAPETLWGPDLAPNGFQRKILAFPSRPFVAHGVGLSMATADARDAPRRAKWIAAMKRDQRTFAFQWYTDHLGASTLDARALTLPLPAPMSAFSASTVRSRLEEMRAVVPDVGVENNVAYFLLGDALDEPAFITAAIGDFGHVLLDLHNLHTMALNHRFDPLAYLARLDLARVIEIHVSGGAESDPAWLPGGRTMRLDSHDHAVPEEVWALLEYVVPRCPNLRGVTLERMEGTVRPEDVPVLRAEITRARAIVLAAKPVPAAAPTARAKLVASSAEEHAIIESKLADAMTARDPLAVLRGAPGLSPEMHAALAQASPDGVRISALLVAQLRFERLIRGSGTSDAWFARDPAGFTAAFRAYHAAVPPTAFSPWAEAALFEAFQRD